MSKELIRHNAGKPDYTLIDYKSLEPMVRVLEFGAGKYERNNWKLSGKNAEKLKILESLQRHVGELIDAVNDGTPEVDHESHEHLIGHILCNCMFYSFHHVIVKNIPMNDKRNSGLDWEDRFFQEYGRFPAGKWELEDFKRDHYGESSLPRDPIEDIIAKGDQMTKAYEPTPQIKPKKPTPVVVVEGQMQSGRMYGNSIPQQIRKEPKRTRGLNFKVQDF